MTTVLENPARRRLWADDYRRILTPSRIAFFWERVDQGDGCWTWTGNVSRRGYGRLNLRDAGRSIVLFAHTTSWFLAHGDIPEEVLDHLCRNTTCVNPAHLEPVTIQINTLRGVGPTALNARKTQCPRGHELSGSNVETSGGRRRCRICKNESSRRTKERYRSSIKGSYSCSACGLQFRTQNGLNSHAGKAHEAQP